MSLRFACVALLAVAAAAFPLPKAEAGSTHWALLIAGSNTWGNYRHQADVYHAYQIMKRNGLKDENIIVFHYDDIAGNSENPHPGKVINKPDGGDVYAGVPKDYTGSAVNAQNFLAVLAGDKTKVKGGSGKVLASGPNDMVFVFYSDHGGTGILGMPEGEDFLYGKDIVSTLQAKAAKKGFKQMAFYIEACESGSIFAGTLPSNINIYATTASNPDESSWGCYCPGMTPAPPAEYDTCLGDLYSVSWMENADQTDLTKETLLKEYQLVSARTSQNGSYEEGSHVMQYGQVSIDTESCAAFMGLSPKVDLSLSPRSHTGRVGTVDNRDANLHYLHTKYMRSKGDARVAALRAYKAELAARLKTDDYISAITTLLGMKMDDAMATPAEVRDWDCYKQSVNAYQAACGKLRDYGMKYGRAFVNMCNAGITANNIGITAMEVCA